MTQFLNAKKGDILHNTNGSSYQVLRDAKGFGPRSETVVASMGRYPWVCIAHGIRLYGDGQIDWAYSDGVGFVQDINRASGSVDALLDELGF